MKTIYMFAMDPKVEPSFEIVNQLKVVCYLLYDELSDLEMGYDKKILDHENVTYNELLETNVNGKYYYRFKYNDALSGRYEPFMINEESFGFTVNSSEISYSEISVKLEKIKKITNFNYDINIESFDYIDDSKKINRLRTLRELASDEEDSIKNSKIYKKTLKIAL